MKPSKNMVEAMIEAVKLIKDTRLQCPKCGFFKKNKSFDFYIDENGITNFICYDCETGPRPG